MIDDRENEISEIEQYQRWRQQAVSLLNSVGCGVFIKVIQLQTFSYKDICDELCPYTVEINGWYNESIITEIVAENNLIGLVGVTWRSNRCDEILVSDNLWSTYLHTSDQKTAIFLRLYFS